LQVGSSVFQARGVSVMKFLLGLSALIILFFMGLLYSRSCKKTADDFLQKYIEENNVMLRKDGRYGEDSVFS
jgi:hypothetical protein